MRTEPTTTEQSAAEVFRAARDRATRDGAERTSGEQVAACIRTLVCDGYLRRGDRVPQDDIAAALGVSRIPVREALLTLELSGWLVIEPHRGAYILGLDERGVRDHYALLGQLWAIFTRRVIEADDPERLARLQNAQEAIQTSTDALSLFTSSVAFTRELQDAASTPRLVPTFTMLEQLSPGNFFEEVPGTDKVQKSGTARIMRAIRQRDTEKAAQESLRMLEQHADRLVALLESRNVFARNLAPTPRS